MDNVQWMAEDYRLVYMAQHICIYIAYGKTVYSILVARLITNITNIELVFPFSAWNMF